MQRQETCDGDKSTCTCKHCLSIVGRVRAIGTHACAPSLRAMNGSSCQSCSTAGSSPSSRNYVILSAITALYAISACATYTSLQDLGLLKHNLEASTSVVGHDYDTTGTLAPDPFNGISVLPSIQQVVCVFIADGILVSLLYISLISSSL